MPLQGKSPCLWPVLCRTLKALQFQDCMGFYHLSMHGHRVWLGAVCLATKLWLKYTDIYISECFGSYKRWNNRLMLSLKGCPSNCLCLPLPTLAYLTKGKTRESTFYNPLFYSAEQTFFVICGKLFACLWSMLEDGGVEKQRLSQLFGSLLIHYLKNNALRTKSKKIKCWVNSS